MKIWELIFKYFKKVFYTNDFFEEILSLVLDNVFSVKVPLIATGIASAALYCLDSNF